MSLGGVRGTAFPGGEEGAGDVGSVEGELCDGGFEVEPVCF